MMSLTLVGRVIKEIIVGLISKIKKGNTSDSPR